MRLRKTILAAAALAIFFAPAVINVAVGNAQAVPNCGGQGAARHDATVANPYVCNLPGLDVTVTGPGGQPVTRHFAAQVTANGLTVSATFKMTGGVLPVDVPIRVSHHFGVSGGGGPSSENSGFIRAGQTTGTVTDSFPCRDGQFDVKAWFTANGDERGRVGGPWILNGTEATCLLAPGPTTTAPATTTTPTTPASVAPLPSVAPSVTSGSTQAPQAGVSGTLPATGHGEPVAIAVVVALFGAFLVVVARSKIARA